MQGKEHLPPELPDHGRPQSGPDDPGRGEVQGERTGKDRARDPTSKSLAGRKGVYRGTGEGTHQEGWEPHEGSVAMETKEEMVPKLQCCREITKAKD